VWWEEINYGFSFRWDLENIASFLWINPSLRSRLYWERNSLCSNAPNKKAQSLGLGTPSCSVVYA
ncbi:hypothetical protein, partial [Listeria booriae]|uniref:hypothetical protein n=1 Tax=Listeria booriae TaxID=1552123 RepID=UPI0039F0151D